MVTDRKLVEEVTRKVVEQLAIQRQSVRGVPSQDRPGIFSDINDAIAASETAFFELGELSLESRRDCITSIRSMLLEHIA